MHRYILACAADSCGSSVVQVAGSVARYKTVARQGV